MIAPNMATMLSIIATDADVPQDMLARALNRRPEASFNRIVVDGDMSTNDTVLLLANGASGVTPDDEASSLAALHRCVTSSSRKPLCATAKARRNSSP